MVFWLHKSKENAEFSTELKKSEISILQHIQKEIFYADISALETGKELARSSKSKGLNPYLDNGLLLVGSRLENANIPEEQKHPTILPSDNIITCLIFFECHEKMLHCGPQLLLAEIKKVYWPIRGRVAVRFTTRRCVICKRPNPTFD